METVCVSFSAQAQGAANNVHGFKAPQGMTLVAVSVYPEAFTGTPTGFNVDVNVGGATAVAAVAANTTVVPGEWKARHYGGANDPVPVAGGQVVTLDANFAGGTTPTADYDVQLFFLMGTV